MRKNRFSMGFGVVLSLLSFFANAQSSPISQALQDMEAEQEDRAKNTLLQLTKSAPSAENYYYLGYACLRLNLLDSARISFEQGLGLDPNNHLNTIGLAGYHLGKEDRMAAKVLFDKAYKETKSKNEAVLFQAAKAHVLFEKTNDPAEAIRLTESAIVLAEKNKSKKGEYFELIGDVYKAKNEGGPAISNYEKALEINPKLVSARTKIARIFTNGKNLTEALQSFEMASRIDSNFAPIHRGKADLYIKAGRYKQASESFKKYLDKTGRVGCDATLRMAKYAFASEDFDTAIQYGEEYNKCGKDPIIYRILGHAYYKSKEKKPFKTVENIEKLIQMAPEKLIGEDYEYYGRSLKEQKKDSLAVIYLVKASDLDSTKNFYTEIGSSLMKDKKYKEAAPFFEKSIAKGRKYATEYQSLGLCHYVMKKFVEADSAFAKVNQISGSYIPAFLYRARIASNMEEIVKEGEPKKEGLALPHYQKVVELGEKDKEKNKSSLVEAYKYMASYEYNISKSNEKARDFFVKIVELDPNDAATKSNIEALNAVIASGSTPEKK